MNEVLEFYRERLTIRETRGILNLFILLESVFEELENRSGNILDDESRKVKRYLNLFELKLEIFFFS